MITSGSNLQLEVGQFSHPGRKRTNNEDWLGAFQPEDAGRRLAKGCLFIVADGMGGHRSGELASRRAVDHVIRTYFDDPDPDAAASLERSIRSANASLYAAAEGNLDSGRSGTTLVAAVIQERRGSRARVWIANVGDSRAYLLHGRQMQQLSRDHSWAAAGLGGAGLGRHVVTRALGLRPEVKVDIFPFGLQSGDQILLCSDGLTGPLPDPDIQAILDRHPPQEAAQKLVEAANDRGGPDNVSAIVIRLSGQASSWEGLWDAILDLFGPGDIERAGEPRPRHAGLSRVLLVVLAVLVMLALVGLGFVLGSALF